MSHTPDKASAPEQAGLAFRLETFEWQVHQGLNEEASRSLISLLKLLDSNYAQWGPGFSAWAPGLTEEEVNPHLCTRIAGSITALFSRPGFMVSDSGFEALMNYHRWLAIIFAVSEYRHGDHIIRNINAAGGGVIDPDPERGEPASVLPELLPGFTDSPAAGCAVAV